MASIPFLTFRKHLGLYVCVHFNHSQSNMAVLYPVGAVASMFWVDAELGSDIYLDGKMFVTTQPVFVHHAV